MWMNDYTWMNDKSLEYCLGGQGFFFHSQNHLPVAHGKHRPSMYNRWQVYASLSWVRGVTHQWHISGLTKYFICKFVSIISPNNLTNTFLLVYGGTHEVLSHEHLFSIVQGRGIHSQPCPCNHSLWSDNADTCETHIF